MWGISRVVDAKSGSTSSSSYEFHQAILILLVLGVPHTPKALRVTGLPRPFAATLGSENGFVSYPERVTWRRLVADSRPSGCGDKERNPFGVGVLAILSPG